MEKKAVNLLPANSEKHDMVFLGRWFCRVCGFEHLNNARFPKVCVPKGNS